MGRHTMGNDWGGRHRLNPSGCRKVAGNEVRALAEYLGIEVRNEGLGGRGGMWWEWQWNLGSKRGEWRTMGQTNFIAYEHLKQLQALRDGSIPSKNKRAA